VALREQLAQGGAATAATWQPQMYTPDHGRGGVSLLAATPGGAVPSLGVIQQQLNELPPLKKKRGRPTKAEMEARRERARLELLAAQRIHGGDLPPDMQDMQDMDEQARQKQEQEHHVQQQIREQESEQVHDSGQANEEIEEDESEEGGPDSPDTEE
jgi:hypothetical protein